MLVDGNNIVERCLLIAICRSIFTLKCSLSHSASWPFVFWWVEWFIHFTDQQRRTNRNEKFISDNLEIHWKIVFIQLLLASIDGKGHDTNIVKENGEKCAIFDFIIVFVRFCFWFCHNRDLLAIVAEEKIFTIKYFMRADNTIMITEHKHFDNKQFSLIHIHNNDSCSYTSNPLIFVKLNKSIIWYAIMHRLGFIFIFVGVDLVLLYFSKHNQSDSRITIIIII